MEWSGLINITEPTRGLVASPVTLTTAGDSCNGTFAIYVRRLQGITCL